MMWIPTDDDQSLQACIQRVALTQRDTLPRRDQMALAAMAGLMNTALGRGFLLTAADDRLRLAELAYQMADAMLQVRDRIAR